MLAYTRQDLQALVVPAIELAEVEVVAAQVLVAPECPVGGGGCTMQKFADTKEGLTAAVTSHLELEKMLGGEKVPIPKGPDDKEGWQRYSKAMGVPVNPNEYG